MTTTEPATPDADLSWCQKVAASADPFAVVAALAADEVPAAEQALLRRLQAIAASRAGESHEATRLLQRAANAERQAGEDWGAAHTVHLLAMLADLDGDLRRLRSYYSETFAHAKTTGNRQAMALCLRSLGELALLTGDADRAATAWHSARRLLELAGRPEAAALPVLKPRA